MKHVIRLVTLSLAAFALGCAANPFHRGDLPVIQISPADARSQFARTIPDRFISDDTILIRAPFHNIAILGVAKVDRTAGKFDVVALNQLGVELFVIQGDARQSHVSFAIPPLDQQQDLMQSIADDFRHIYFDLLPADNAKTELHTQFIRFTQPAVHGVTLFEFGDQPPILLEKRQAGFFGTLWRAQYFDYAPGPGGLYPRGIVLDNAHYFYRIIVKNRDIQKP